MIPARATRWLLTLISTLTAPFSVAVAQSSTSFRLQESALNAGGNPLQGGQLSSSSFRIRLDSIGEATVGAGIASGSYRLDTAFVSAYRPPAETLNLRFTDKTTLTWNPERSVGNYQLYRGLTSTLPGTWGSCLASNLPTSSGTDAQRPTSGASYFYLVTARNRLREEGTKGNRSNGSPRSNTNPCP
jgi:hypothetical protein